MELHNALGQQRVVHAARTLKRLGALFHRKAQELHAVGVLLFPLRAAFLVCFQQVHQLSGNLCQVLRVHHLGEVGILFNSRHVLFTDGDLGAAVWHDLDFNLRRIVFALDQNLNVLRALQVFCAECFFD